MRKIAIAPNPTPAGARIHLRYPHPQQVAVSLYDIRGRLVREFPTQRLTGGESVVEWDGRNGEGKQIAGGLYFFLIRSQDSVERKAVVVLR
jgi:flagellar hook assembly protein FlgD